MFCLGKAYRRASIHPLATLLEEFDALEAFEDGAFAADGGTGFKAVVLGHCGKGAGGGTRRLPHSADRGNAKMEKIAKKPLGGVGRGIVDEDILQKLDTRRLPACGNADNASPHGPLDATA